MTNYIFTELEAYAKLSEPSTGIQHACNDATFRSHGLISDQITRELRDGVAQLEDISDEMNDWHLGSNGQVLDLVHPSLYCLVYDHSLSRPSDGSLTKLTPPDPPPGTDSNNPFLSQRFAWLPSDFAVDKNGEVRLISPYINNLHKSNEGLYSVIPKILGCFIPMFERVLGAIGKIDRPHDQATYFRYGPYAGHYEEDLIRLPGRIQNGERGDAPCVWSHEEDGHPYDKELDNAGYPEYPGRTKGDRYWAWLHAQPKTLPDSHEQYQGALDAASQTVDLRGHTLQRIVKLANIHLSPEKPNYPGGSWHVEGMLNERIVATRIYYYDSDNISESQLKFRTSIRESAYHRQSDSICMEILYGIDGGHALVQERGSITTSAGLALAFPNIYQHRVSPFHLADPNKPGHRKILAFFLVDPNCKIPSATDIAPQQEEWMLPDTGVEGTHSEKLPPELRRMIVEATEGLMSRKEANGIREELMKERSNFVQVYDKEVIQVTFNMYEH